ncbi:MAG: 3-oxoacyl-ACP reductase FabG [Burkholderia sp.]|nr:3-oxoacyl-ACP reductase FabG [Burkholderia sp.]
MEMTLDKQVAIVTGASRGIGQAIMLELMRLGATVIGTATSQAGVLEIRAVFEKICINGRGMLLNVNDAQSIEIFISSIVKEFGRLNILVNNAGITRDKLVMRMRNEDWDEVIDTNLRSVFRLSRAALRPMIKARDGRIINITSIVASVGNPGQANYAASKAGVVAMTRVLVQEIGNRGVTINCIAPGFIDSDMTNLLSDEQKIALKGKIPLGRFGCPKDIAHAVTFLSSPQANYITGTTLHVNGGMYMV